VDQPDATHDLLCRWHKGERQALAQLLERDLPWLRDLIHRRLGPLLKRHGDTVDYVQDAMLEALSYGPKFVVSDLAQFRSLLARIVENMLRDRIEYLTAKKRDLGRQSPLPSGSVLDLDPAARSVTRPSEAADANENQTWVRLAVELLDPDDRKVILLREWHGLSFGDIAAEMGIQENTARMKFTRALPKLAEKLQKLKQGLLPELVRE
jgi:RNA polymerase sigma-70 factor (ECF subfamily)